VETEKGHGAEFIVELPRAVRTRAAAARQQTSVQEEVLRPVGKG
jgi:hypothetical protein